MKWRARVRVGLALISLILVASAIGSAASVKADKAEYAVGDTIGLTATLTPAECEKYKCESCIAGLNCHVFWIKKPDGKQDYIDVGFVPFVFAPLYLGTANYVGADLPGQYQVQLCHRVAAPWALSCFSDAKTTFQVKSPPQAPAVKGTIATDKSQYIEGELVTYTITVTNACSSADLRITKPDGSVTKVVLGAMAASQARSLAMIAGPPVGQRKAALYCGSTELTSTTFTVVAGAPVTVPPVTVPVPVTPVPAATAALHFLILNKNSGQGLSVPGGTQHDGAAVTQQMPTSEPADHELWEGRALGTTGYFLIVAKHSGKCLEVQGGSSSAGAAVVQTACHGGTGQQWQLRHAGGGWYTLVNRKSGLCMTVQDASSAAGAPVVQQSASGDLHQLWELRLVLPSLAGGAAPPVATTSGGQGTLQVTSTPSGAQVYIDGVFSGTTPLTLPVAAGTRAVTVRLAGYPDAMKSITIQAGAVHTVQAWFGP